MKMNQYNWNWWFVLTSILMVVGILIGSVAENNSQAILADVILTISLISMLPCLYVGMKPSEN